MCRGFFFVLIPSNTSENGYRTDTSNTQAKSASGRFLHCTLHLLSMERPEFEKLVQEGFLLIPEKFRERIQNVALLVEDEPSDEVRRQEGLAENEMLLGLYQGIPATLRGDTYGIGPTVPDTITLFKVPIEEAAREDGVEVQKVIAETIWHEYAHYFGMDEDEVRFREEKRKS